MCHDNVLLSCEMLQFFTMLDADAPVFDHRQATKLP